MPTPIHDLKKMSSRARVALENAGFLYLEEAAKLTDKQLVAIPYFGESSLKRLRLWQGGHSQPDGPAGGRRREDRIWSLYLVLRQKDYAPEAAMQIAIEEADEALRSLRESP